MATSTSPYKKLWQLEKTVNQLQAENKELKDLLRWCWKYRIGHAEFTIPYCIKQQQRIKELIEE